MTPTTFQMPELRDNLDNIIQAGAYGKKTAFCNAQNTGVLDYINNNLMYLWTNLVDEPTIDSKISAHNLDTNSHADIREALEHVSGVPLGTVIPFSGNNALPNGFLLCNGASVARTMYPDLFNIIGTTYGAVDSEHFNLPDLRDKFIEGADTGGTIKEAGLPNIEGGWTTYGWRDWNGNGAISSTKHDVSGNRVGTGETIFDNGFSFDASRSNPIYGNSTTVQPPALTMRYIIKAFDGQTEESALVDVTQYENELNNKLDKSGGVMTGGITYKPTVSGGLHARLDTDSDFLRIAGATVPHHGAGLLLFGQNNPTYAGQFMLDAMSKNDEFHRLLGEPNGTLTWDGRPIATTNKLSMPANQSIDISSDIYVPVAEYSYDGQVQALTDGYLTVACNCTGYISFIRNGVGTLRFTSDGSWAIGEVPLSKGQIVGVELRGVVGQTGTKFIYAQSAL